MRLRWDPQTPPGDPLLRGVLAVLAVGALLAARFFPFSALPSLCTFKNVTGLPCVSCGMTRSWIHLVHGRVSDAIVQNPLGTALCVGTVLLLVYGGLRAWGGLPALRLDGSEREKWVFRGAVGAMILANWSYVLVSGVA